MPIKRDVSSLPSGKDDPGTPPVPHPLIVTQLAEEWYRHYLTSGEDQAPTMQTGARWRASWSGMCARQVSYLVRERDAQLALLQADTGDYEEPNAEIERLAEAAAELAPSDPPSIADAWRFGLGTMVHESLQKVLVEAFPGAQVELSIAIDDFGSATVDIVIDEVAAMRPPDDGGVFRTVVELKTINGFGYKDAATTFKGAPTGPRTSALIQGAVAAAELDADRLIIGYLSLECLSPDVAARNHMDEIGRFAAEWHYEPEVFVPLAEAERKRVKRILAVVDEGKLAPRQIPDLPAGARIVNPATGQWEVKEEGTGLIVQSDKTWQCGYCSNRSRCLGDGA